MKMPDISAKASAVLIAATSAHRGRNAIRLSSSLRAL